MEEKDKKGREKNKENCKEKEKEEDSPIILFNYFFSFFILLAVMPAMIASTALTRHISATFKSNPTASVAMTIAPRVYIALNSM